MRKDHSLKRQSSGRKQLCKQISANKNTEVKRRGRWWGEGVKGGKKGDMGGRGRKKEAGV